MTGCVSCGRALDDPTDPFSLDCGGDCLMCMARAGDPECARSMRDWADASYNSATKEQRAEYRAFVIAMPENEFGEWRGNHYRIFGYHRERAWRDEAKAAKRKARGLRMPTLHKAQDFFSPEDIEDIQAIINDGGEIAPEPELVRDVRAMTFVSRHCPSYTETVMLPGWYPKDGGPDDWPELVGDDWLVFDAAIDRVVKGGKAEISAMLLRRQMQRIDDEMHRRLADEEPLAPGCVSQRELDELLAKQREVHRRIAKRAKEHPIRFE